MTEKDGNCLESSLIRLLIVNNYMTFIEEVTKKASDVVDEVTLRWEKGDNKDKAVMVGAGIAGLYSVCKFGTLPLRVLLLVLFLKPESSSNPH